MLKVYCRWPWGIFHNWNVVPTKYLRNIYTVNSCCKRGSRKHKFMELFCDCRLPANHYALLDEMLIPDNETDFLAKLQYQ